MDPFTIIGLLSNVHEAVSLLQKTYEILKDAPEGLAIVISQASVFEQELDRLSSIQRGLTKDRQEYLLKQVNSPECNSTIEELQSLVSQIKPIWDSSSNKNETEGAKESMKLKERISWLRKKDEVKKLADKLARQADRVKDAMLTTVLYVESKVWVIRGFILC
jgi:hypothetical protein